MKTTSRIFAAALGLAFALASFGCATTSSPGTATDRQVLVAKGVSAGVSLTASAVLAKNTAYIPAATALALALDGYSSDTLTQADVANLVDGVARKVPSVTDADKKMAIVLINSAWKQYVGDWQAMVAGNTRPDVKLFIHAVASGLSNAAESARAATS
jgi:hypothetical protein